MKVIYLCQITTEDDENDSLTITAESIPTNAILEVNGNGTGALYWIR